uniref:Uncharacterized protein B13B3.150 n=1 Tax=Neurospora crassa TaxID=5141 RepID=Q872R0_NEUCS|nr:putative protein [Neurospora crassa]
MTVLGDQTSVSYNARTHDSLVHARPQIFDLNYHHTRYELRPITCKRDKTTAVSPPSSVP